LPKLLTNVIKIPLRHTGEVMVSIAPEDLEYAGLYYSVFVHRNLYDAKISNVNRRKSILLAFGELLFMGFRGANPSLALKT
jgi:hypothetical protein